MKIFNCAQMREIEEKAANSGFSYPSMMKAAGNKCAENIMEMFSSEKKTTKICVICGKGNNGGDGLVIARRLIKRGYNVTVVLAQGMMSTDISLMMFVKLLECRADIVDFTVNPDEAYDEIKRCDLVIDCLFGIGFKGEIKGSAADFVEKTDQMNKRVISIDVPSGLDCDGTVGSGVHFNPEYTFAIGAKKPVHVLKPLSDLCGTVKLIDIGFDKDYYGVKESFSTADDDFIKEKIIRRRYNDNKGTFGKLLNVCGSRNMQGAAVLCARAAVRSGAGLVYCAFPEKAYCAVASKLTVPLMLPLPDDKDGFLCAGAQSVILEKLKTMSSVVIGCGLGLTDDTQKIVSSVIESAECPVVVDADGINAVSLNINILKKAKAPVILTPHPGEMSRLTGLSIDDITSDRAKTASDFAKEYGVIVLLKGANTVIASPDGRLFINPTGNAGMAKGGSGDMLSGMIGAFSAQGMSAFDAAVAGAYLHGLCGDIAVKDYSYTGLTPSIMLDYLPMLFSKYE